MAGGGSIALSKAQTVRNRYTQTGGGAGRGDNRSKPVRAGGVVVRYKVKFETVAEIKVRLEESACATRHCLRH